MIKQGFLLKNKYIIECFDKHGRLKWREVMGNIYVNTGLDDVLDKYWKGSSYTAAHYVGLISSSPTVAAADTISSHSGWTEDTTYSETVRQTLTLGTVSGQSVSNSASVAAFSINGESTLGGIMIATNNTKGGTTGILIAAGAFSGGNQAVSDGDTVNVTVTLTSGNG